MSDLTGISQRNPFTSLVFILLTALIGFLIIGPMVGFFVAMAFYDGSMFDLIEKIQNPLQYPEIRMPVLILQAGATLIGLIIIPALYLKGFERASPVQWLRSKSPAPVMILLTALAVLTFMAPNSVFIEWNSKIVFPEFMKEFATWARQHEDLAAKVTEFLTSFESTGDLLFGIFVIAVLPAFGEELVFRGMLQPELYRATKNHHAAIWISAIIFSAFHMQFFGFVPRVLLGALFGYLYLWSANFWMPVIAHFVNNAFSVIMMYLYQTGKISLEVESTEAAPWPMVLLCATLFVAIMVYFRRFYKSNRNELI